MKRDSGFTLIEVLVALAILSIALVGIIGAVSAYTDSTAGMRARLAFYGSTPAYRIVLDTHGWGDLQTELNTLSKRGDWATMSSLITDDMLDELCVVAPRRELPKLIRARYGDLVQRVAFDIPDAELIAELKEG